jgi:hypothetical protein
MKTLCSNYGMNLNTSNIGEKCMTLALHPARSVVVATFPLKTWKTVLVTRSRLAGLAYGHKELFNVHKRINNCSSL